ncbi:flagellar basal body-associated FliL family protein [Maritalea porphyrae]|uniref:flagellar basal body-associated FliL family protein n=1 Tax=Maritalea porphyrae TaxID=880732 RepID=UPI0022AFFAD0|nr:flagellar basal body-associated FliL family protein [Maritalea porphyrae]MCZ4272707.1 flagellar basal body-associated FliL family protein [Maritalea porphyrae]
MSDQTAEDTEGEEGEKKKGPPLMIIIGAAVVLLLGGGAAYFFLFSGGGETTASENTEVVRQTYFYDLPIISVNLNSKGESKDMFLKVAVSLELADEAMVPNVETLMPRVLDTFQVYLREMRKSDLEGSGGIYRLKEELRRRVNLALFPTQVESIVFKEILVQ